MGPSERWRQAAVEPYTDAPTTTDDWLKAIELGADAAVRVVLEDLLDEFGPDSWDLERRLKALLAETTLRGPSDG